MNKERIKLTDSMMDVMYKMSEGNPGGLTVLAEIVKNGATIDPDIGEPLFQILQLDSLGIYGSRIWMLYKDVCKHNLSKTLGCVRAWQMGIVSRETLNYAIDNRGAGMDLASVLTQLKIELPNFKVADE